MCRLMAYIGQPTCLADVVLWPDRSIIKQSYDARERLLDPSLPFHLGHGVCAPCAMRMHVQMNCNSTSQPLLTQACYTWQAQHPATHTTHCCQLHATVSLQLTCAPCAWKLANCSGNLNGDGFGIGWYSMEEQRDKDPTPCVFTSITPAW